MKKLHNIFIPFFLTLAMLLTACGDTRYTPTPGVSSALSPAPTESMPDYSSSLDSSSYEETSDVLDQNGSYYDLEQVVLYLYTYDELPSNYITKSEARELGWEGGSVERYLEGAAIGGDSFGNREGLLPQESGRRYTECDLNTNGASSRGAERLIFSNDGLYFYTEDHYESFTEVWVEDGAVVFG